MCAGFRGVVRGERAKPTSDATSLRTHVKPGNYRSYLKQRRRATSCMPAVHNTAAICEACFRLPAQLGHYQQAPVCLGQEEKEGAANPGAWLCSQGASAIFFSTHNTLALLVTTCMMFILNAVAVLTDALFLSFVPEPYSLTQGGGHVQVTHACKCATFRTATIHLSSSDRM